VLVTVAVGVAVRVELGVAVRVELGVAVGNAVAVGDEVAVGVRVGAGDAVGDNGLRAGEDIRPGVPVVVWAPGCSPGTGSAVMAGAQAPSANTPTKIADMSKFFERTSALSPRGIAGTEIHSERCQGRSGCRKDSRGMQFCQSRE
jgi:hypothetical protein